MLKKVRKTINNFSLIKRGEHLLLAVSGGADSVALLRAMVLISPEYQLHLTTAHLNHGLRGEEAGREEAFVRSLSTGMGIACICKTVNISLLKKGRGQSLEEIGREERYRFLNETARTCGAQKIVTGHHRDDQAETVLINLIRGTGSEGLKGIALVRDDRIIRPLLHVSREEILEFLNREGLEFMVDSSNLSALFLRNRIRNDLIPELASQYNPRIVTGLCNMAEIMRREDEYLQIAVRQILSTWGIFPGSNETIIPINAFSELHEAMQGRVIKYLLEAAAPSGYGIGYRHIEAVLELTRQSRRNRISLDLPCMIGVEREGNILKIKKSDGRRVKGDQRTDKVILPIYSYPVEAPGVVYLPEIKRGICFEFVDKPDLREMKSLPWVGFFDYERLSPPLILRNIKPGDQIELLGMSEMKKLKEYFIDRKIPYPCRRRIPLLVDTQSVLWIAGERVSNRVKVTEQTKKVLRAEMV